MKPTVLDPLHGKNGNIKGQDDINTLIKLILDKDSDDDISSTPDLANPNSCGPVSATFTKQEVMVNNACSLVLICFYANFLVM
jgi:hypothetical protein